MTLLNFKKDFVPLILDRSKPHTIRRERKHPIKVGDTLQLYYGLRTKSCILIGTAPCIRIQEVDIYPGNKVLLNEAWLIDEQIWELARRDGFSETSEFFNFFKAAYALPTSNMRLIWWDVNQLKINRAIYDVFSEVYDAK
jgi:hypothetical protein